MLGSDDGYGSLFFDKLSMFMLWVLGYERMFFALDNSVLPVYVFLCFCFSLYISLLSSELLYWLMCIVVRQS